MTQKPESHTSETSIGCAAVAGLALGLFVAEHIWILPGSWLEWPVVIGIAAISSLAAGFAASRLGKRFWSIFSLLLQWCTP
jgi:drug/metabolite transporter (DMT)-like permease